MTFGGAFETNAVYIDCAELRYLGGAVERFNNAYLRGAHELHEVLNIVG